MNSREWDAHGWSKHTNTSGEVIRIKTYKRILIAWDNKATRTIVAERKRLTDILGIPYVDLLSDLNITVDIERYPRHRRFLKHNPLNTYYKELRQKAVK